jgi:DNA-binding transcriptional ArsR family regulator
VLDVDPDLAHGLPPEHFEAARARSRAVVITLEGPGWDPSALCRAAEPGWLGLLMIEGLMIRLVSVGSRTACELFGPGDVVRPWDADGQYEPLQIGLTWRVTHRSRLAVLDTRFGAEIGGWPTIVSCLMSRVANRARALALNHAVSHLPRVDSRLLVVFWLLAERWGKVTADGIRIPLHLTHEVLAMLVGTRRPTVTLSLQRLAQADLVIRERRDRWLLTKAARDYLNEPTSQVLQQVPALADLQPR